MDAWRSESKVEDPENICSGLRLMTFPSSTVSVLVVGMPCREEGDGRRDLYR